MVLLARSAGWLGQGALVLEAFFFHQFFEEERIFFQGAERSKRIRDSISPTAAALGAGWRRGDSDTVSLGSPMARGKSIACCKKKKMPLALPRLSGPKNQGGHAGTWHGGSIGERLPSLVPSRSLQMQGVLSSHSTLG